MKRRLLSTLLVLCMVLALLPETVRAAETSGKCGDNVTWSYSDGTLTIQGSGDMKDYDYASSNRPPWNSYLREIHTIRIVDGVTSIGACAFFYCRNLINVTISNSVTSIGPEAFRECDSLSSVTIPNSVTSIGERAFQWCRSLISITIPDSVTHIGNTAFYLCHNLASVTISSKVTSIEEWTFAGCDSLTSVVIPNSVTSIGKQAFYTCNSLTSVTIPDSVTSIEELVFAGCSSLTDVYYSGSKAQWENINIGGYNTLLFNAVIHYGSLGTDTSKVEDDIAKDSASSLFSDVDKYAEYTAAIEYVNSAGLMTGDDTGKFNPNKTVTRAEMAVIVCRMLNVTKNLRTSSAFSDVPTSHWANIYITKATELGIINGYGNGKFGPSDPVTYEQALKMIMNASGLEGEAIAAGGYPNGYISVAHDYGITRQVSASKGTNLRRWEIASILYNKNNETGKIGQSVVDEIRSALTSHVWESSTQTTCLYRFNSDGTGENLYGGPSHLLPVTYSIDEATSVVHISISDGRSENWTYSKASGGFTMIYSDGPYEEIADVWSYSVKEMYKRWADDIDGTWKYTLGQVSAPNNQTTAVIESLEELYEAVHAYLGRVLSSSAYSKLNSDLASQHEQMESAINQVGLDGSMQRLTRVIIREERTMAMVKEMIEMIEMIP